MSDAIKALDKLSRIAFANTSNEKHSVEENVELTETIRAALTAQAETGVNKKKLERLITHNKKRLSQFNERYKDIKINEHGGWTKGYLEGKLSVLEDWLDSATTPPRTEGVTIPRDEFERVKDALEWVDCYMYDTRSLPQDACEKVKQALSILEQHRG